MLCTFLSMYSYTTAKWGAISLIKFPTTFVRPSAYVGFTHVAPCGVVVLTIMYTKGRICIIYSFMHASITRPISYSRSLTDCRTQTIISLVLLLCCRIFDFSRISNYWIIFSCIHDYMLRYQIATLQKHLKIHIRAALNAGNIFFCLVTCDLGQWVRWRDTTTRGVSQNNCSMHKLPTLQRKDHCSGF